MKTMRLRTVSVDNSYGRRPVRGICLRSLRVALAILAGELVSSFGAPIRTVDQPGQLDIWPAGENGLRITLKPLSFEFQFPQTPALVERDYGDAAISLRDINEPISKTVGKLHVEVRPNPFQILVTNQAGDLIQDLTFEADGGVSFNLDDQPVLGMGEGGPQPGRDWRDHEVEFDRRGRYHEMRPRWQSNAYGSRNPVAFLVGTSGWGLFVATPWVHVDLCEEGRGRFIPWEPPSPPAGDGDEEERRERRRYLSETQGRPPMEGRVPGLFDLFVFNARDPAALMKDVATITGPAVLPPKWSLGYMQSHRTLEDDTLMIDIVDTFREKQFPLDAVIYLGTGFTPIGWNTRQPSFSFNAEVFKRDPTEVIADIHERHAKFIVHMVPWQRDRLPTLQGTIPPKPDETLDASHISNYWRQHVDLVKAGVDAWWPDEGDWFDLSERMKRHQLYYQGPLSTTPNVRPWSLHRNGHLGIARWGGWVWSGDTQATWKTLEAQIAVGINHSLSLSPYWGSDTGGFYTTSELTGELYARWFQFSAFCPSFRSHGRIWRLRLPWGWGLSDMGPLEDQRDLPKESELNNPAIEPVCRRYAELRYQLMPYTYTLAWEARETGLPFMRALWLHYPEDELARGLGDQYLWGRDLLVAPVFKKGATSREVYLPKGVWYDWWTNEKMPGGQTVTRPVDLATMPLYARAGAIIPVDPLRQYTDEAVDEPTTLEVYRGADGAYTLYEDDGVSLDYLQGRATRTRFTWKDAESRLIIEPAAPEGMPSLLGNRKFEVEIIPDGPTKTVLYEGQRIEEPF